MKWRLANGEMAILCARVFAIDFDRETQSPFTIFQRQKEHEDEPVKKAQGFIEANFQDRISVDQLASEFALGRRNLERRFKKGDIQYGERVYSAGKSRSGRERL
ncbi:MAG: hypothetical protein LH609_02560 [Rudanella sp.]|nr:hypothetical protein [Rudanella sp.]